MNNNESLKGVLSSYSSGELRKKENNAYLNEVIKKVNSKMIKYYY